LKWKSIGYMELNKVGKEDLAGFHKVMAKLKDVA